MKSWFIHLARHTGKLLIFWLLFFTALRAVFFIYYRQLLVNDMISTGDIAFSFIHAFRLDLSTACYLMLIPLILQSVAAIHPKAWIEKTELLYGSLVISLYSLIAASELGLYGEWKTKLSYKAITYLKNPAEVFNSVSSYEFFSLILIWIVFAFLGYLFMKRLVYGKRISIKIPVYQVFLSFIVFFFLIFTGIRGGWTAIPITTSAAYFSQHNILNMAAVNPGYNMLMSVLDANKFNDESMFRFMKDEEASKLTKAIHQVEKDSTISILKVQKPNIVILLLESWSGDMIESLGGEAGITPEFRKLEQEGLLFTNFYASGNRSQQAMGSLFAGIPGLPITTITNHPEKYASLPSFVKDLKSKGYYTSFYFGGELIYGNILSYLMSTGFDKILEGKDLDSKLQRGKLGIHDEFMFRLLPEELSRNKQPFFTTLFTLSSHSPYDFPMEHSIQWPLLEKDFVNSVAYTDRGIGEFFALARKERWYNNTLFILMADHSHNSYRNHELQSFPYHKIPLLLCGPALADSLHGKKFEKISGNTDLTSTLLHQLGMPADAYPWSKNLLNAYYKPFAWFELNDGFGWKRPDGEYVWNEITQKAHVDSLPDNLHDSIAREGKAYLQSWYGEFLKY
jgi:phosphoglycerol transferase MdoB-like AlkP superfamily enzyme